MKLNAAIFSVLFIYSFLSQARITDNQVTLNAGKGFLKIEPKKGFHLNVEAPANAIFDQQDSIVKPAIKKENRFEFKLLENTKKVKISFYVCDDKKTACEQHQEEVVLGVGAKPLNEVTEDISTSKNLSESLISRNGKPTLLVFSAPWCPACIRMQTETYPSKSVAEQLKKTNFLKLNSDLPENFQLSEKFHVRAIPTLILLNTDGEETYRWLDYQVVANFAKSLQLEVKKTKDTKTSLFAAANLGDAKAISALGRLNYNSLECAEAIKWLSLSKELEDQKLKLAVDVSCSQEAAEKDEAKTAEYLSTLEKGMALSISKIDQERWLVDWVEKKKELNQLSDAMKTKSRTLLASLLEDSKNLKSLEQKFRQSTFGETAGFELAEVYLMRSRLLAALELKSEKEKSDQQLIQFLNTKKLSTARPGEMLIAVAYFREAGESANVETLYNRLTQKYPKTYVYYEKYARYMLKQKKLTPSLKFVDQALLYPEGNEPQLYLLKARILKELNKKEEALQVVEQAMKLKNIQHAKFKNTVAQLGKLKDGFATNIK